jgi:hypothetical protein
MRKSYGAEGFYCVVLVSSVSRSDAHVEIDLAASSDLDTLQFPK